MRAPRRGFVWAAATGLLISTAPAFAAEPGPDTLPVNVIAIQTPDADDQAEALTKALRNAVRGVDGWSLGEGDYSLEVLMLSLKCPEPPDADCQSKIADQIKADRYVWGIIEKKDPNVVGTLHMWVRGQGTKDVPISYSANLTEANDEALKQVALDGINKLTGGPPKGGLHVKAGQVQGQLFVDGQPMGALTNGEGTFMVPAGSHKIMVKAEGYADAESSVVVKPSGAPADVSLALVPLETKAPMNWKKIGGFGAIGLGAVFAGVGLASALKVNGIQNDDAFIAYQQEQGPGVPDVCATAATDGRSDITDLCDSASSAQAMQLVFFPLAAISAGVGAYLVVTSNKKPADAAPKTGLVRIDPQVGLRGGKLGLTFAW